MIRIGIALPYPEAEPLAQEVFQEHTAYMKRQVQDNTHYLLETIVAAATDEVLTNAPECDVMIARGGTYLDLCKRSFPVPLVELIVSGSDIVEMLLRLRHNYSGVPAAILGTQNMVMGVEQLGEQLSVDVTPYTLKENTYQEVRQTVERAVRDGKRVIIGGKIGCQRARELGIPSMQILSGRDTFWNAIAEAKQVAKISLAEREKALSLQTLLDNAYEGLFAIDRNGCVSFLNAAAIRILQLSTREHYLGRKAAEVLSSPALNRILSLSGEYDEIIPYKNTHLSVKKVELLMHGAVVGSVVTVLNASQIQTTEDKLRMTLHHKGHSAKYSFDQMIIRAPRMLECVQEAKAFARTDSNIVIVGESGTGKELVSQSIHAASRRSQNNFVALNCAALPENLLESELFGYVEGAFTGAAKGGKAGLFEIAHKGTIFLDEISEIPLGLQGRLLRVLQEREIMRLGDSRIIPIDIRVIAATNKNLEDLVRAGRFRQDLYYRLYVLQLNIPPLRERKEDIPPLVDSFIRKFRQREGFHTEIHLTPADYALLQAQPWYGNVRELRNFCERFAVLFQPGTSPSELLVHLLGGKKISQAESGGQAPAPICDRERVLSALEASHGNKTRAAAELGISRVTLWRLLKQMEDPASQKSQTGK